MSTRSLIRDLTSFIKELSSEHFDELLGLGTQLALIITQMPVDDALAVLRVERVFDFCSCIAQVEHELGGS